MHFCHHWVKVEKCTQIGYYTLQVNDFTGKQGVRGKDYQAYRQGHAVCVYQPDGTVSVQYFTLDDGAVMLEPDVRAYFPDSEAVNAALRALIALVPNKPKASSRSRQVKTTQTG